MDIERIVREYIDKSLAEGVKGVLASKGRAYEEWGGLLQ